MHHKYAVRNYKHTHMHRLHTYIKPYVTPRRRPVLEKLTVAQLLTKFLVFYRIKRVSIVFATAHLCSQPSAWRFHPTPSNTIYLKTVLIISFGVVLVSQVFPSL
jgi:hypothetical protein